MKYSYAAYQLLTSGLSGVTWILVIWRPVMSLLTAVGHKVVGSISRPRLKYIHLECDKKTLVYM